MTAPLLDSSWYFKDDPSDKYPCRNLSMAQIRSIQDAFICYMEEGLTLDNICAHVDNSEFGVPDGSVLYCATAYAAVAMTIPHPRLSDLILYVRTVAEECEDYLITPLQHIFSFNDYRKYSVLSSITDEAIDLLTVITSITTNDCIMAYLVNDPVQAPRIFNKASEKDREKALSMVRYHPERMVGLTAGNPVHLGHKEILAMLGVQSKALFNTPDSSTQLYDRQLWIDQPLPQLDQQWELTTLKSPVIDHGVLDLPQTLETIRKLPAESIKAIKHNAYNNREEPIPLDLVNKLIKTLNNAGIENHQIVSMICNDVSYIEYLDSEASSPTSREEYFKLAVLIANNRYSAYSRAIGAQIIRNEPYDEVVQACTDDRLLNALYLIANDKGLLYRMSDKGRDKAFSSDLGL